MGDYGARVSKTGYDVKTATDTQLVYSSAFNNFKVYAAGTTTLTLTGGAQNHVDVSHSLGYVPAFIVFVVDGTTLRRTPTALLDGSTGIDPFMDSSKLRVYGQDSAAVGGSYTLKYYIFIERIS